MNLNDMRTLDISMQTNSKLNPYTSAELSQEIRTKKREYEIE